MQPQSPFMSPDALMLHLNRVHYDLSITQRTVVELITMVNAQYGPELTVVPMSPPPGATSLTLAQIQAPPHPEDLAREQAAALVEQSPATQQAAESLQTHMGNVLAMVPPTREHAHHDHHDHHHDHHPHPHPAVSDVDFRPHQPTPWQPPSAPAQPTLARPSQPQANPDADERAQERFAQRAREQLKHFIGNGSLFATHLSPQTIQGGKGFIRPNLGATKLYEEDLRRTPAETLKHWPSGFYRNRESSEAQFFLNATTAFAVVEGLLNSTPTVSVLVHPEVALRDIHDVTLPQLLMLKELFEAELRTLGEAAK